MSASFLLIRHGMCDPVGRRISGRLPGISLNEEGRLQASRLPERLSRLRIRAIYSSPLQRTRETAEPLSRRLDLPITCLDAFNEIDYGEWTGKEIAELAASRDWQAYNQFRGGRRIPGGELALEAQARAVGELERLAGLHRGEAVAVFSHGDVIRFLLLHYLGSPVEFNLRLEIRPASVSVLHLGDWGPVVSRLNDDGPLGEAPG